MIIKIQRFLQTTLKFWIINSCRNSNHIRYTIPICHIPNGLPIRKTRSTNNEGSHLYMAMAINCECQSIRIDAWGGCKHVRLLLTCTSARAALYLAARASRTKSNAGTLHSFRCIHSARNLSAQFAFAPHRPPRARTFVPSRCVSSICPNVIRFRITIVAAQHAAYSIFIFPPTHLSFIVFRKMYVYSHISPYISNTKL